MKLHYQLEGLPLEQADSLQRPVVLIHGLFGSLDNLAALGRGLQQEHPIIKIDLRNHGLSPHSDSMSYPEMALDVLNVLDDLNIDKAIVVGHSMGGKVTMALANLAPQRVEKLVVIDMSPVNYTARRHDNVFNSLQKVTDMGITERPKAATLMRSIVEEEGVIQFLLKSFNKGEWRFNVDALLNNYDSISDWQEIPPSQVPALFIRGANSQYIIRDYQPAIVRQFPQSRGYSVAGAGHWVHAERPETVLAEIKKFITNQ